MKIKVKNGKWTVGGIFLDLFINEHREPQLVPVRSKIDKKHNYNFKFKNR